MLIDNSTKKTASFLYENIITRYGYPVELVNDQGTHFLNETVEALTHSSKTNNLLPQMQCPDREHKVLKSILTKMVQTNEMIIKYALTFSTMGIENGF